MKWLFDQVLRGGAATFCALMPDHPWGLLRFYSPSKYLGNVNFVCIWIDSSTRYLRWRPQRFVINAWPPLKPFYGLMSNSNSCACNDCVIVLVVQPRSLGRGRSIFNHMLDLPQTFLSGVVQYNCLRNVSTTHIYSYTTQLVKYQIFISIPFFPSVSCMHFSSRFCHYYWCQFLGVCNLLVSVWLHE